MKKKRVVSEETRLKISLALKGKPKNYSEVEKKIRSELLKGNTLNIGRVLSQETKDKIRQSQPNLGKKIPYKPRLKARGKIPWNKGLPMTELAKAKLSEAKKGKKAPWMNGNQNITGSKNPNYQKTGEEHPCWREEKKRPFYKSVRELYQYKNWRTKVFERDRYSCIFCKEKGIELNSDHYPKRFIDIMREYDIQTLEQARACEELWDTNNGRTLCVQCHRKTDTWGRRKN